MSRMRDTLGENGLGALTLATAALAVVIVFSGVYRRPFEDGTRGIKVKLPRAAQLQVGDPVRMEGLQEGKVGAIERLPGARGSLVTLEVSRDAGPIYADAEADVRWRNLLGGSFYVALDRGTPGEPPLGDRTIPASHTSQQVELDDAASILRGGARTGLRTLPLELARALADPNAPAAALGELADVAPSAAAGLAAARGRAAGRDLPEMIESTATTVRALDAPGDDLRELVAGAAATVRTTAGRAQEIRSTLAQGPGTATEMTRTLRRLERTLGLADGLASRLDRSAADIGPTLAALRPTVAATARLLTRARPLVRALRPTMHALAGTARNGMPLVDDLRPSIDRLETTILPYFAEKDRETGKTTTVMVGGMFAAFAGFTGQIDQNGYVLRFPLSAGTDSAYLPCRSSLFRPADQASLLSCDALDRAIGQYLSYAPPPGGGKAAVRVTPVRRGRR